jgi:proliferating cell nuclear antigen PCNA
MKIIYIETDENIADLKLLFEITNGYIHEANTDFIKDHIAYSKSLDKKKKKLEDDDEVSESSKDKNKKNESSKSSKSKKSIKDKLDDEDEDAEIVVKSKKSNNIKDPKISKSKKNKEKYVEEEEEDVPKKKNKGKSTTKKSTTKKDTKTAKKKKSKDNEDEDDEKDEDDEENPGLIKILTADPNQVMITFITLKASAFKKFIVHPDKYSVGLNLDELYKYMKNVDKEGTMTIHIDDEDTQNIVFNVTGENTESFVSTCELRVLNLSAKKDRKIETDVTMAVRLNCHRFHKACKDLLQFSQFVEITCDPSQLAITCKGELSNHKRVFRADGTDKGAMIRTVKKDDGDVPQIIRLVFDLRYINYMYKCSSLCDDMEIYLNPDSVMFLKYGIKMMGEMFVGISPSKKIGNHIDISKRNRKIRNKIVFHFKTCVNSPIIKYVGLRILIKIVESINRYTPIKHSGIGHFTMLSIKVIITHRKIFSSYLHYIDWIYFSSFASTERHISVAHDRVNIDILLSGCNHITRRRTHTCSQKSTSGAKRS